MLTLIAAHDRNGGIGRAGTIPWRAPGDLAAFKRETLGGAVIMGRKTWESLPQRPLPDRLNIVVSAADMIGVVTARHPEMALSFAEDMGHKRIYAAGGSGVYAALLPHAQRLLLTEVDLLVADADTFLPDIDLSQWTSISQSVVETDPKCLLREYLRVNPS